MSIIIGWVLLALYVLLVLRWLSAHVELTLATRSGMLRPLSDTHSDTPRPAVAVIIAAHNEQAVIEQCLARVLAQDYPGLTVLVANDRSSDATGDIVRRVAAQHPNVRCVDIADLPEGWLGKTHALSVAARDARGDYLLFLDSDVELHPATVSTAVDLAQRHRLDFMSLWPKVTLVTFWERFLLPACGWTLGLWFPNVRPDRIDKTPVFANGQFLMMRREAYEQIGGHAAVPDEMAEDVSLAQLAARAGMRRYLGLGGLLLRTRMYEHLNQIVHGWTRIFIGTLARSWKLAATIFGALIGVVPAFIALAMFLPPALAGSPLTTIQWIWLIAAAVHLPLMYTVVYRYFRMAYDGRPHILLFPVALLGVCALLAWCMVLVAGVGTIRWGNMRYRVRGSRAIRSDRADA
jgi:cellulose synthase/poly-beta-1,6-N-acetylglucosamine synthase-like glycosyltransferase